MVTKLKVKLRSFERTPYLNARKFRLLHQSMSEEPDAPTLQGEGKLCFRFAEIDLDFISRVEFGDLLRSFDTAFSP